MFFDIDKNVDTKHFCDFILKQINNCRYHIASASSSTKFSYHIIFDYFCDNDYNHAIANDYNTSHFDVCDVSVYAKNKSLRRSKPNGDY